MANVRGAYDSKPPQAPSSTRSARPCGRDASPGMSAGNWERPRRGGRSLKFCSLTRQAQRRQDDWHRARYGALIVEIDALFDDDIASAVLDDIVAVQTVAVGVEIVGSFNALVILDGKQGLASVGSGNPASSMAAKSVRR